MRNIFVRFSGLKRYNSTFVSVGIVAATTILAAQAKAEIVKFQINDDSPLLSVEPTPDLTTPTPEPTQELKVETKGSSSDAISHTTINTSTSTNSDGQPKSNTTITTDPQNKVSTNPETNDVVIDGGSYTIKLNGNSTTNDPISKNDDNQSFRTHSSSNESHSLRINSSTKTKSTSTSH